MLQFVKGTGLSEEFGLVWNYEHRHRPNSALLGFAFGIEKQHLFIKTTEIERPAPQ